MTPRIPALILLAGIVVAGCGKPADEEVQTTTAVPVSVEAAKVETLIANLSVSGTIAPAPGADWVITAPAQGTIAELPRSEGQAVRQGDLLVRFDIPSLLADVASKKADVEQARGKVATTDAAVTRLTGLVKEGIAAQKELQDATQAHVEAQAALQQAQSASTAADALAERATVRARFDGVVARRWHNPGDLVDGAQSDPILRVVDPAHLQVIAAVPLADLARVAIGQRARVTGPAGGDGDPATVFSKPAQVEAGSATADVRLTFDAATHLPVGAAVKVDITAETRPNVLTVPAAAVIRDGDETFVMVAGADNTAHKHPVKTGLVSAERVQILSGLAAGDQAIVRGQDGLPDHAAIQVVK